VHSGPDAHAVFRSFNHQHGKWHSADDAVADADREALGRGERAERKFGGECTTEARNLSGEARVRFGIHDVHACAEGGDSLLFGGHRPVMGVGVDSAGGAAEEKAKSRSDVTVC
jgi:hypothetical protein